MNITARRLQLLIVVLTSLLVLGCRQESSVREYTEIVLMPPAASMPASAGMEGTGDGMSDPHKGLNLDMSQMMDMPEASAKPALSWDTPNDWDQDKGQGMRLATFHNRDLKQKIECTIVSLGPTAGDIKANVVRWIGQLKLAVADDKTQDFISKAATLTTKDGKMLPVFDFTQLQASSGDDAPSMIGAIIKTDNNVVFVKMTGSKSAVMKNKASLTELITSIRFAAP